MKLLLTSGGVTNDTLAYELEGLVGKKFSEMKIGFIPNAAFGDPSEDKSWLINHLYQLLNRGAQVAIISLADLTTEEIVAQLADMDVVLVGGGNTFYLSWLFDQKNMFEKMSELLQTKVYVGISAGSMIATSSLATTSNAVRAGGVRDDLGPAGRSSAKTLGLVSFLLRPHLNTFLRKEIDSGVLQKIVSEENRPIYALDDQCAVKVIDDEVTLVGEGEWKYYEKEGA